jgi:hypothetical protein
MSTVDSHTNKVYYHNNFAVDSIQAKYSNIEKSVKFLTIWPEFDLHPIAPCATQ